MKHLFSVLFLAIAICMSAQNMPTPIDSSVRKGVLPNGLTYYIRHNQQPKERCEFHIAQNVGSILEREDQLGLAHFLEHMAFNGSENFPDKGIINYFEKIGVNFGGNINAYTSIDETVYRLSDVPTYREGILDSALLALYDWSCALTLADSEIDKERGVIVAEWRTTNSPSRRLLTELFKQMYAGSQYENRMPIGDTTIIKNFTYQALRDYYHKWYGPDLQAIVVVGDIDVDKMEQKVKALFGKIPARKNRGERPMYGLRPNKEPIIAFATDKEAQNSVIQLQFKHEAMPNDLRLSVAGYTKTIIDNIISTILSYRFEEQRLDPNADFLQAYFMYDHRTKGTDVVSAIIVAKEGKEKEAFKHLLTEIQKVVQHGFTNSELERAKTDILNSYEKSYNERNTNKNITLAQEYIRNYIDSEPIPGIAWEYDFVKQILPVLTTKAISDVFNSYITDENLIVAFQGADKPEVVFPSKSEVLATMESVKNTKFDAPKEEVLVTNLVDKTPKAGKVKKRTVSSSLGTTEWILSNGARVVFKPTDFKQDEILLNAFSWGGTNTVALADLHSANFTSVIMENNGLGKFSYLDLQKALTGKIASVYTSIADDTEGLLGSSSIKDFETMLQLIYLKFQKPRRDETAYNTTMEQFRNYLINREKDPKSIFADSLSTKWSCHDERNLLFNTAFLEKVNYDKVLDIYQQRFASASDFTFVFTGNINPNDKNTEKLITTWIGSLPKGKTEKYTPQPSCTPKGKVSSTFVAKMEIENIKNAVIYHAPMQYNWANSLNMTFIGYILDYRYMESVREDEGGSYGVGVRGSLSKFPTEQATLRIRFDCHPEKQKTLINIIHEEIKKLATDGPSDVDFNKAKEGMIKDYAENIAKNNYWSSIIETYYMYDRNYIKDYRNAIDAVTKETIKNTLQQLLDSGNVFEMFMFKEK